RAKQTTLPDSSLVRRPDALRCATVSRERPSRAVNSSRERSSCFRRASNSPKARPGGATAIFFFGGDFFGAVFGFFAVTGCLAVVLPRPTDFAFVTGFIGTLSYQIAPEPYKSSHFDGRAQSRL